MFATSNILTHINYHKSNQFDIDKCDDRCKLRTILFKKEKSNKMFTDNCISGYT